MKSNAILPLCALLCFAAIGAAQVRPCNSSSTLAKRANIIFIMTDDQDLHLNSLSAMPLLKMHMIDQGLTYSNHYCTVALCCPSRVSLLTGRAAHRCHLQIRVNFHSSNTNVTEVSPPYGGYPKFISQGLNDNYLPVWLQAAGYNTYYAGKLMNSQSTTNYNQPPAKGFNHSHFLLDPFTYSYINSVWIENAGAPVQYTGQHTTDLTVARAYSLLDEAVAASATRPFFLTLAPIAPHFTPLTVNGTTIYAPPVPQDRYKNYFLNATVPRTANFNPDKVSSLCPDRNGRNNLVTKSKSGASWVKALPKQSQANVDYNDAFYRARLQALAGVDEMVDGLFSHLAKYGILNSTYIVYTTDNGFHIGQHRMQPGKACSYEEDINIPLIIRGPDVPTGETTNVITTHTDLAPTFFNLMGINLRADFDGTAIPVTKSGLARASRKRAEHVNLEFWGRPVDEGIYAKAGANNTYKTLRLKSPFYNLYYSVWCTNEHELYDMTIDPYQMNNLLTPSNTSSSTTLLGIPLAKVGARLDALLFVLKSCTRSSCVEPWRVLHPQGDVTNLIDVLDSTFDAFYEKEQAKISFSRCELGYLLDAEGPQVASSYSPDGERSWWT